MSVTKGLGHTFDGVASQYEKFRPGYPCELYEKIFEYMPADRDIKALEVGSGAGQATLPILSRSACLTAVEPGVNFCNILKNRFDKYPGFSVINSRFEDAALSESEYDLVFSATAFHWVPEKEGYEKVFSILKKGGVFARFANRPYRDKGNPDLAQEIDSIYERYYNTYHNIKGRKLVEFSKNRALEIARIPEKYGFSDVRYALFNRVREFSSKEYTELLGTYSDHIAIEEGIRREFFAKVEEAIDRHGGSIAIYDTIDLELARKI